MPFGPVGRHPSATPPGPLALERGAPVALAAGTQLLGEYQGGGRTQASYLIRGGDGRMLEVSPLLYLVAANLDGRSSLDDVAGRVGAALGRSVSAESIGYLVERKLEPLGILGAGAAGAEPQSAPLLALSLRAGVVPPGLVRRASGLLRPLFLPPVVVAVLLGLVGVDGWLITRHNLSRATHDLVSRPGLLLVVVGLMLAAGLFHELGHATASRYGKAEPGVIGVGVYLLWPVFFNDLNDSYRLPRRARVRADLGGVYFNVVFILVLAGAYAATGSPVLLVAVAMQHLAVVQQFLPFVRLDGYYLASDLAGVPDLFGRIRPTVRGFLHPGRREPAMGDLTRRARVIVTAWVVTTVPVLGVLAALLLARMPGLLAGAREGLGAQATATLEAIGDGRPVGALLGIVQVAILAVPLAGLGGLVLRSLVLARRRHRRNAAAPAAATRA